MRKNNQTKRGRKQGKSTKRHKLRRRMPRPTSSDKYLVPKFRKTDIPFGNLDEEQRRVAIFELARNSEERYQESLATLRSLLRQCDPLQVLSQFTIRGFFVPEEENSGTPSRDSEFRLHQFHVEVLHALMLQIDPQEFSSKPCNDDILWQIFQHLINLCIAHYYRQFDKAGTDLPKNENSVAVVQQLMRGNTQAIRNRGHHSRNWTIARELYCAFDERLLSVREFSVSDVFGVFETMVDKHETRLQFHFESLSYLFSVCENNRRLLIKNYHEMMGLDLQESERMIESVKRKRTSIDGVRAILASHYDRLLLTDVHTVSALELAKSLHIDETKVAAILDEYALDFGALRECKTDHLHLSNPVWRKPLIGLGDNKYCCLLSKTFLSFVIPCIEAVLISV